MGEAKQRGTFEQRYQQALKQNAIIDDYFKKAPKLKREMLEKFGNNRTSLAMAVLVEVGLGAKK